MNKKRAVSHRQRQLFSRILSYDRQFSLPDIERQVDKKLVRRVITLTERIEGVLKDAVPASTHYNRRGMAVDLADLWHAGEELRKCLRELLSLRFPRDKSRFKNILLLLDPLVIHHMEWHLKNLKKRRRALLRRIGRVAKT